MLSAVAAFGFFRKNAPWVFLGLCALALSVWLVRRMLQYRSQIRAWWERKMEELKKASEQRAAARHYINRHARKFIEDEMKANGEERAGGMIGSDVPDDICYQWALDYFRDSKAEEDKEPEEKFVPKPYTGSGRTRGRTSKKAEEKKPEPKPAAPKNQAPEGQIGFGEMLGAA